MSEREYAPLSSACVRALHDKLYEKRKTAALEIEKMVREFHSVNNTSQIRRLLKVLGQDFAVSQNPHAKKGGLIGLASIAVALGKDSEIYMDELLNPILSCLSDQDSRVRYYACESLYNVVKIARNAILSHFCPIFNALCKLATDPDQNVKSASELLDRLMKDIVTECLVFDLESFLPLLRERISSRNSFARQFVIAWISVLNMVPNLNLISHLPDILDGLFKILDDPIIEVKKMCEALLGEFLRNIKSDPSNVNFSEMINILIVHAQEKNDDLVQFTAITWIKEFVQLSGPHMLPYMSGIFTAVLPCLSYDSDARRMTDIKETATAINYTLMKLLSLQGENPEGVESTRPNSDGTTENIDLTTVVTVLTQFLAHNSIQTKVAVLKWIYDLYLKMPEQVAPHLEVLFPALQRTLLDQSDEVVQQCLVVIAEIISPYLENVVNENDSVEWNFLKEFWEESDMSTIAEDSHKSNSDHHERVEAAIDKIVSSESTQSIVNKDEPNEVPYFTKFISGLLNSFKVNNELLDERGSFIIRQLCMLLRAETIYLAIAEILRKETDFIFVSLMVEHLNMILLTSSELFELRERLKYSYQKKDNFVIFICLYRTWRFNAAATVALCFLTQHFECACNIIKLLGDMEITVNFLTEIDKFVQLIESPIFAFLRLELLEVPCDQNLVRALYGLLMLLPQSDAFHTLKARLDCIPSLKLMHDIRCKDNCSEKVRRKTPVHHFNLFGEFIEAQNKYKELKKKSRVSDITTRNRKFSK
ncbi:protein VAC14 homolog isoform X3 [Coccinella septempunctata]|uniref:protein VAC14 homolog isoform X3 n=1 Tax=Coccinella septempunctata TaxID=41139 RepID=UPI001D08D5D1|nr:protein VAC14 homolog isoform X3 [Coccinella septempunctata]